MTVAELILGRNIGDTLGVSEADFARFLDREVTTRFPDGFTVRDAAGQWRDTKAATIVREPAKMLLIALPGDRASLKRVTAVAEAYKRDFRQQSVLTILRSACVGF